MSDIHQIVGEARSNDEVEFFISLHPCPTCGSRSAETLRYRSFRPDEVTGLRANYMLGPCAGCELHREFRYSTTKDVLFADPERGHLGGPEPSQIISPAEFRAEVERLAPSVGEPEALGWPAYKTAWDALERIDTSVIELRKFLPAGATEIPAEHFRTDEARAARTAHPERYTRAALEALHEHWTALLDRYKADLPRYHELRKAGEAAAPPPPPPPAFTPASLEAHRRWVAEQRQPTGDAMERAVARSKAARGGAEVRAAIQEIADVAMGKPPLVQRLEAIDVAQPGARLAACELSGSKLTRVDLAGADLSSGTARGARWTQVKLAGAKLGSFNIAGSELTGCDLSRASLGLTVLGDSIIHDCSFAAARADRSAWYRCDVTASDFEGAVFGQAAFDNAVFADCAFRGASLAMDPKGVMGSAHRAWFYRCDFRDVDWTGRLLYQVVFIDCWFGGARGTPQQVQDVILHGCTLDPDGPPLTLADLVGAWQFPLEKLTDNADKQPRADPRSRSRRTVEDGQPVTYHEQVTSPLILAESARNPSYPVPVPF